MELFNQDNQDEQNVEYLIDEGEVLEAIKTEVDQLGERIDEVAGDLLLHLNIDSLVAQERVLIAKIESLRKRFKSTLYKMATAAGVSVMMLIAVFKDAPPANESWQEKRDRAEIEMEEKGITWEQRNAYVPGANDLIYRGIGPLDKTPSTVEDWKSLLDYVQNNLIHGRENTYKSKLKAETAEYKKKLKELVLSAASAPLDENLDFKVLDLSNNPSLYEQQEDNPGEEDSWRLYLGLPQKYHTYKISKFKPTTSKGDGYYYAFNSKEKEFHGLEKKGIVEHILKKLEGKTGSVSSTEVSEVVVGSRTMYHFQWSKGQDERGPYIAYYDIWDLNIPIEKDGVFGKPFEIYDRIYYNPKTFEINDLN